MVDDARHSRATCVIGWYRDTRFVIRLHATIKVSPNDVNQLVGGKM